MVFASHIYFFWMSAVIYGSVNGVWGSIIASILPNLEIYRFRMSPVYLSMLLIFVTVVMEVLVSLLLLRYLRMVSVVGFFNIFL